MSQITIRGLPPEVEKEVRDISKNTGKSLSRVIQEIIFLHTGFSRKRKTAAADSLRNLAGGWSKKEASIFLTRLNHANSSMEK